MTTDRDTESCAAMPLVAAADHYFRHLFEHAGIAMISTENDLTIRTWNAEASKLFGASSVSMIGTPLLSVIPSEGRAEAEQALLDTLADGSITSFDFHHRDLFGDPRTLAVTVSPAVDDDGERIGTLACFRDITRRIQLEAEIGQRNKMVSLGRMAGALAHHFNNILCGAVTSVDFALATDEVTLQSRALRQTSEVLARATKLVDSLMAFAEGDQRHRDECDLIELIRSIAVYMRPEMASQQVTLVLDLQPIPPTVVPSAQLITVIENVLHNAVDAMPDGGETILTTRVRDGAVELSVTDHGVGMEPAEIQKAVEPFYTTKSNKGMDFEHHPGLGLTVAHGILQVLGHTLSIDSQPGEYTNVTIRFKVEESPAI